MTQTVKLLEELREIAASVAGAAGSHVRATARRDRRARWRHIDLAAGKMSVVESAEQTAAGMRYKPPKSGRGRTSRFRDGVSELRQHRLAKPKSFLGLGVRQSDADVCLYPPRRRADAATQSVADVGLLPTHLPRIRFP